MGDRGNIVINNKIYLYTHWSGQDLPNILAIALNRGRERWCDRPYLTRIIFSEMIRNDIDGTNGFGIDYEYGDGGNDIYVNTERNTITYDNKNYSYELFIKGFMNYEK